MWLQYDQSSRILHEYKQVHSEDKFEGAPLLYLLQSSHVLGGQLGFGGVLQLWGGYDGATVTTLTNCDFTKGQAMMGGAIGFVGGELKLIGDEVPLSAPLAASIGAATGAQAPIDYPIG